MILISAFPLEGTRSADRSCKWRAECVVCGVNYAAESRSGAPNELARKLIAAGVDPGLQVEICYRGAAGHMSYPSLAGAAKWTFEESAHRPLRRVRYRERSWGISFGGGDGQKRGDSSEIDSPPVPSSRTHEIALSPEPAL
jgi:hypothetical protein